MYRRTVLAVFALTGLSLTTMAWPATAQEYPPSTAPTTTEGTRPDPDPPTDPDRTTTTRGRTTTTGDGGGGDATSTVPPRSNRGQGSVSEDRPSPGQPVGFRSGRDSLQGDSVGDLVLVRGRVGAGPRILVEDVRTNEDGSISVTFIVPEDTAPGIYYVVFIGIAPDGTSMTIIVPIVVVADPESARFENADASRPGDRASDEASTPNPGSGSSPTFGVASASQVPRVVRLLQASVADDAAEQALVEAVLVDGADLVVDGNQLLAIDAPTDPAGSESQRPLVAAGAAAIAAAGLLALRHRASLVARRAE